MAENANVSTIKATFLPGSMAIAQTVGRLFFGHLASNKYLEPVASNQVTMLVCTIATTLCPMANSFSTFLAYAIVVGFFDSCSTINAFKVVEELVGLENLSSGYAIQMVGTAFSTAIGPVAAGFLYEYFGSYTIPFAIAGAFQTACVCILFLVSIKKKKKRTPILGEEEMFPKDLSSFQISNDSGIDSDGKETNKSDHMSGLLAIGIHSSLSRLSHMEYDICKNKSIEKKSTWCKYKGMFPNKIDEENIIILERETVL